MHTNSTRCSSSEYVKQFKFSTIVAIPSGHFSVNFTCFHNSRPNFLVCVCVCICVCARLRAGGLVYVTLPTYDLNNRTHTHTHTPIYMPNIVPLPSPTRSISTVLHSSRSAARLHSAGCVHGDASCVCVRDKIAYSSGIVVRAVGLPWWWWPSSWWPPPKYVGTYFSQLYLASWYYQCLYLPTDAQ